MRAARYIVSVVIAASLALVLLACSGPTLVIGLLEWWVVFGLMYGIAWLLGRAGWWAWRALVHVVWVGQEIARCDQAE
jgi:hypothetical protein